VNLGEHKGDGIRHSMHLSAPKGGLAQMLRDPDGQWVPFADYEKVKSELDDLKAKHAVAMVYLKIKLQDEMEGGRK
jgi:hypothetical protein